MTENFSWFFCLHLDVNPTRHRRPASSSHRPSSHRVEDRGLFFVFGLFFCGCFLRVLGF